jgi:hypothetical protein
MCESKLTKLSNLKQSYYAIQMSMWMHSSLIQEPNQSVAEGSGGCNSDNKELVENIGVFLVTFISTW